MNNESNPHNSRLRDIMSRYRLNVNELAQAAGVSRRSIVRLRMEGDPTKPRPKTVRRIADGLSHLTHLDSDELFRDLMHPHDPSGLAIQGDLGTRGAAELVNRYQRMNPTGRHLLLEQARLLGREFPGDS